MSAMKVEILEEHWTRTTIQTVFSLHSLPRRPQPGGISVDLPLLNLGWTFALSLRHGRPYKSGFSVRVRDWTPAAFSFRRHESAIRWEKTFIHAQLALGEGCPPQATPLATLEAILADTPALECPVTIPSTIPSLQPSKLSLTVTISNCPFANGLFDARLGPVNEAQVHAQLVRQSGNRLLRRSLTTGKLFDVKFLTNSTRSRSGNTGDPLPTYASLSVLEEHVDLSSSVLRENWTNALAALDSAGAKDVEVAYPEDNEFIYEPMDSDYEDEDEDEVPCESGGERVVAPPEDQQSESGTERSSSSLSSFEPVNQPDERTKNPNEPSPDSEPTILVKFAAHRTWHAFLWYCYTGDLEFCKLKSQVEPGGQHLRVTPVEGGPPTCSPKSMYRLADLVGNKDLKAKALAAIKQRMTEANVLDETFSVFTSKYPEVRNVQLGVLMEHCGSPKVKEAFLRAMKEYNSMAHAETVLSAFYDNLVE